MVSKHAFRVEVFQANECIGSGHMRRHLVQRILPLTCDTIVRFGKLLRILPPVPATLYFAGQALVQALNARLTTAIVLLVLKHLATDRKSTRLNSSHVSIS